MKNILSKSFIFLAGVGVGSAVTLVIAKRKYERIAQEEIECIRELYSNRAADKDTDTEDAEEAGEEPDEEDLEEKTEKAVKPYVGGSHLQYNEEDDEWYYEDDNDEDEEEDEEDMDKPYVIPPEEFDEEGYETISLYYYDDGVVENILSKKVIDDVESLIGEDSLTHFGEYEMDSVFVRNDRLKTDFEILRVNEKYYGGN